MCWRKQKKSEKEIPDLRGKLASCTKKHYYTQSKGKYKYFCSNLWKQDEMVRLATSFHRNINKLFLRTWRLDQRVHESQESPPPRELEHKNTKRFVASCISLSSPASHTERYITQQHRHTSQRFSKDWGLQQHKS